MADSTTPNHGFVQPEVGASKDTWGEKLNDNWFKVDALLAVGSSGTFMPRTGGTFQGRIIVPSGAEDNVGVGFANGLNGIYWSNANGPRFVAGGNTVGILNGGNALSSDDSIVKRAAGDARYLRNTGNGTIDGSLVIGQPNPGNPSTTGVTISDAGTVYAYKNNDASGMLFFGYAGETPVFRIRADGVGWLGNPANVAGAQIQTRDLADSRYVPLGRSMNAGDGLSGGGDLTTSRTFSVDGTVARRNANNTFTGISYFDSNVEFRIAENNVFFTADTNQRGLMILRQNTDVKWNVNLNSGGDVNFASVGSNNFRVNGTPVVDQNRTVATGAGLTGGGDLSANRTLAIDVATPAEAQAGSANNKVITPLRLAQATLGSSVQDWQDVTGSRASNTMYTNNTGRPITVFILADDLAIWTIVRPGGPAMSTADLGSDDSDTDGVFTFIVPNGYQYRMVFNGALKNWWELR